MHPESSAITLADITIVHVEDDSDLGRDGARTLFVFKFKFKFNIMVMENCLSYQGQSHANVFISLFSTPVRSGEHSDQCEKRRSVSL